MNYAVILAGGRGERFWPLSKEEQPKQFLSLCSKKSMIEQTIGRLSPLIKKSNIYIATNKIYLQRVRKSMGILGVPKQNVFFEPQARNTFAAISVLCKRIYDTDKEAVILIFPSDHFIKNEGRFLGILKRAIEASAAGYIVTIGIKPDRPETGYGYIKIDSRPKFKNSGLFMVKEFTEKPGLKTAKILLEWGDFYIQGGCDDGRDQEIYAPRLCCHRQDHGF